MTIDEILDLIDGIDRDYEKHLVNGFLLITPEQHSALLKEGDRRNQSDVPVRNPMFDIPALVVPPGRNVEVGNRWVAMNFGGTIYAFDVGRRGCL